MSRDQTHQQVVDGLRDLASRPSSYKAADVRKIAGEAADWLETVMSDLRGHERAALTDRSR